MATIFSAALRQPSPPILDTFASPRTVEAGAAGNSYHVATTGMSQSDRDDPTVSFDLRMYIRKADLTWPDVTTPSAIITFAGGPNKGKGGTATPDPGFDVKGNTVAGKDVAFRLNNTGRAVTLGLDATQV